MAGLGGIRRDHDPYFKLRAAVEAEVVDGTPEKRLAVLAALETYRAERRKLAAICELDVRVRRRMQELTEPEAKPEPEPSRAWVLYVIAGGVLAALGAYLAWVL
jgi:hypothetical protein